MKRPMIYWVSLFILGEMISLKLPIKMMVCCLIGVSGGILCAPFVLNRKRRLCIKNSLLYVGIIFLLLGSISIYCLSKDIKLLQSACGKEIYFCGTVYGIENNSTNTYYTVRLKFININGTKYNVYRNICIELKDLKEETDIFPGYEIMGDGEGIAFTQATNPGGYDERQFRFSSGTYLKLNEVVLEQQKSPSLPIRKWLYQIRKKFCSVYEAILDETEASLACAMVLGDKSTLLSEVKEMYQQNGIAHLIAISGLHIAMIGGTLYLIFRKLIGGYVVPVSAGIVFIVFYGIMTGLSGATCRALIMLIVLLLADLFGRKYDILSAVSFALLLMLLNNPYQITQVGFLLSFGAVLGIAVVNPVWMKWFPDMPKILEGFFVSVSVQLMLTPVMLYFFYEIPTYSVFLNVLVVPLMSILLPFLVVSLLIGMFSTLLGSIFAFPVKIIFGVYEILCRMNEGLPFHTYCMGRPEIWWIVVYYLLLILFLVLSDNRRKRFDLLNKTLLLAGIMFCSLFVLPFVKEDALLVSMFDVGQGDCIYLRTPHHKNILLDGGSSSKKNIGEYVLKNGLHYYGCDRLDYAIVSHSDSDHYSGIKELLENEKITIKNVILPDIENPDASYLELEALAVKRGCKVYRMHTEDELVLDAVHLRCLNPEPITYMDKNTGSLVFWLTYEDFDMLLTGDMDEAVEKRLIDENNLLSEICSRRLEVLKVAHHGSDTASSKAFLDIIKPKAAVISVGKRNRYGHPHSEVLDNLKEIGTEVLRTDEDGQISFQVKNGKVAVEKYVR